MPCMQWPSRTLSRSMSLRTFVTVRGRGAESAPVTDGEAVYEPAARTHSPQHLSASFELEHAQSMHLALVRRSISL
jgi:hypothetical protein